MVPRVPFPVPRGMSGAQAGLPRRRTQRPGSGAFGSAAGAGPAAPRRRGPSEGVHRRAGCVSGPGGPSRPGGTARAGPGESRRRGGLVCRTTSSHPAAPLLRHATPAPQRRESTARPPAPRSATTRSDADARRSAGAVHDGYREVPMACRRPWAELATGLAPPLTPQRPGRRRQRFSRPARAGEEATPSPSSHLLLRPPSLGAR